VDKHKPPLDSVGIPDNPRNLLRRQTTKRSDYEYVRVRVKNTAFDSDQGATSQQAKPKSRRHVVQRQLVHGGARPHKRKGYRAHRAIITGSRCMPSILLLVNR
jgi:hypothetical protein